MRDDPDVDDEQDPDQDEDRTGESLSPAVARVERWLDGLIAPEIASTRRRGDPTTAANARLMFVLDNDYGELTTLMYLLLGQELAGRATLLLPPRLFERNSGALPGRTHCWRAEEDVMRAVEAHAPDVVFLCSAYLFAIHELLSTEALERMVGALKARGCRVVTADPYLGLMSLRDPREIVSIDIPADAHPMLRDAKTKADAMLHRCLVPAERILRDCHHLYPSYADPGVGTTGSSDARNVSFYNPELVVPPDALPAPGGARPHWVFTISAADQDTQGMFTGSQELVGIIVDKLMQTIAAGRHPVFIGPDELVKNVRDRIPYADGVDLLTFCPFNRIISLLLTAEHAFYWNVVSHSILIRLMNGMPVVLFDRGHLARAITPMYERVIGWYYQGWEPPYVDHAQPLTLDALRRVTDSFAAHAERTRRGFERAPSPAEMIASVLAGGRFSAT